MKSNSNSTLYTVMDKMEEATAALQQTPPAVEKAKTSLEEGMISFKTRQKHIRIADRSEYGWAAVEEYVEDELADGRTMRRESREQGWEKA